jgi:hypothetical protein
MAISTHRHSVAPTWPGLIQTIARSFSRGDDTCAAARDAVLTSTADGPVMAQLAHLRAEAIDAAAPLGFSSWRAVVLNYGEGSARKMARERATLEAMGEMVGVGEYDQLLITGLLLANRDRSMLLSLSSLTAKFLSRSSYGCTVITSAITPTGAQRWTQHTGGPVATPGDGRLNDSASQLIWRESFQSIAGANESHRVQLDAISSQGDAFIAPLSFDDYAQMAQLERMRAGSGRR